MQSKHYHFSGVCGTAMASLAVLLKKRGHRVTGSDQNIYPPMSTFLEENEIPVYSGYKEEHLNPPPDFVVIGNALSRGNPEVEYALEQHLHYVSMAEVLKNDFIRGNTSIVVSGTHGKTTTTSLIAHVLDFCGRSPGFMVGGIPGNFTTSARDTGKGTFFVTEGDEYDTCFFDKRSKFFHYLPDRLVINNIEFDHADIFASLEEIKKAFTLMLRQIPRNGLILANGDDPNAMEVVQKAYSPTLTFGFGEACDGRIQNVVPVTNAYQTKFQIVFDGTTTEYSIPLMGEFNVRNATAAILLCRNEGLSHEEIQNALTAFKNTRRRLQQIPTEGSVTIFDDFAHHPTAIAETLKAVRNSWPKAKIHALYEARSNTSVRNIFQERMHLAFAEANSVVFSKLHREESIAVNDRLDIAQIVEQLRAEGKSAHYLREIDAIVNHMEKTTQRDDIIVVMSQGAFGGIQMKLAERLKGK